MAYIITGFSVLIISLLSFFSFLYFQAKRLKGSEILGFLKEEYIRCSPYQADQHKRSEEVARISGKELIARVETELEEYLRKRESGRDLSKFELKHERRLRELLAQYRKA